LLNGATGRWRPSLFAAALFAVHPIAVESVAWVAERKNVLCATFLLLTLSSYAWYARKPVWKRYIVVAVLFAAGLASKPMVITLPFVLLLWDYWPLQRTRSIGLDSSPSSWPRLVAEKVPLLALSAISAVITLRAQQAGGALRSVQEFSLLTRAQTAIYGYAMYLWKMLWPARLAPLYPHPGNSLPGWRVMLAGLVLIALTGLAWRFRKRGYPITGWLWFLGTLVPVIGLVQVGDAAMADRYAYIPLIGVFVIVSFAAADVAHTLRAGPASQGAPALAVLILIALALVTHRQIAYWQSSYDLWSHTLQVTENNFVAEDNLGGALVLENKADEAFPHFAAASRINPRDPMSRGNLATYFMTHGRAPEAITQYEKAIELTSDTGLLAQTYANMGSARRALGENEEARRNYEESLRLNPNQFNAWLGLGLLAEKSGKLDEAIRDFSRSVEAQPTAEAYVALGRTFARANRRAEALAAYGQALQISPNSSAAQDGAAALSAEPH
jgi:Flp pilus assembly protein TadD